MNGRANAFFTIRLEYFGILENSIKLISPSGKFNQTDTGG